MHANEWDATMSYGINCRCERYTSKCLYQQNLLIDMCMLQSLCVVFNGHVFQTVIPIWCECSTAAYRRLNLEKLQLLLFGVCTACTEVIGQHLQEVKRWLLSSYRKRRVRQAVQLEVGGGSGPGLYYLDQALFHMSTHLLLAPSQWGAAQRTYLAPLLRLPPLHLPYTGWTSSQKRKDRKTLLISFIYLYLWFQGYRRED